MLTLDKTSHGRAVLLGRVEEQELLDGILESVHAGMSAAVVLRGEAGVGKTAMLEYVLDAASGLDVVRLEGLESETHLGFGAIHRLLVPYLSYIEDLPLAQAQVLRTALGLAAGTSANSFLLGLAVLTLLASITQDHPVICVLDDAQWFDPESLEILGFVGRRIHAEGIGLFFSVREPLLEPFLEGIPTIRLEGLAKTDAVDLLLSLAPDQVDRQVAERIAVQSHGNPLVITEASRDLAAGRTPSGLLLDDPLPLGERLEAHFRTQIGALPDDCQALLLYAAATPDSNPHLLWDAAASDGLDPKAILPAISAGLAEIDPAFRFRHPLIRSAVYNGAAETARRHAHEILALVTDAEADRDLRAWHLAAAAVGPDETVAAELERSALSARARGGFLSETAYLTRAAELSPDGTLRASRLFSAAQAALTGGAPLRAQALLEAGLPYIHDPFLQAQAQKLQVNALHRAGRPGHNTPAILLAAATVFAPIDANLARNTMLEALEQTFVRGKSITGTTPIEVGRAALSLASDEPNLTNVLLESAGTLLCVGFVEAAPIMRKALEALAAESALGAEVPRWFALGLFISQFMWDDHAAYDWLRRCERLARQTGALDLLIMILPMLSGVEIILGKLVAAEARVDDLRDVSRAIGLPEDEVATIGNARLLAWLGQDDAARAAAGYRHQDSVRIGAGNNIRLTNVALLVIELSRGRYSEAFHIAESMSDQNSPGLENEALSNLIESGVRSAHRAEAERALEKLRERAVASQTPWALGLLARSEALLAPDAAAEVLYLEAIRQLERTEVATDLGRAHLLYGEWLRRQKRRSAAREQLRVANDMFASMGAAGFAERARIELAATGESNTQSIAQLTPQEAQIAQMAADGATNQEIATQLFISGHTVEYHLKKVYRKVGVTSRHRLRGALS